MTTEQAGPGAPADAVEHRILQAFYGDVCALPPNLELHGWLADRMRQHVRSVTEAAGIPPAPPANASVLEALRRDGCFEFGPALTPEICAAVRSRAQEMPVFNGELHSRSDGVARDWSESRRSYRLAGYRPDQILHLPHLLELANHPGILALTEAYLGCCPTIAMLALWWSFPESQSPGTLPTRLIGQEFHRDVNDLRTLTLFCFLTDVTEASGAQRMILGSHDPASFGPVLAADAAPDAAGPPIDLAQSYLRSGIDVGDRLASRHPGLVRTIEGPQGSAFVVDTHAFHRGLPLTEGERLLFVVRYGMCGNASRRHLSAFERPSFDAFRDRLPDDPRSRYLNRLFLK